jgi:prophage regulatory protein
MSGSFFFGGMDSILGSRTARQRERVSDTLNRLCETRQADALQDVGGGSPAPAPRTPRRSPATAKAKKSDGGDGDSDPEPAGREHSYRTERLLRLPQVLGMVGVGKTLLYQLVKDGEFPRPRKVRHLSLWPESEVQQWVRAVTEPKKVG